MNGSQRFRRSLPRWQRGSVAVEMALLTLVMAAILLAPLVASHSLMQATLAQRATYNAAHILASYPQYQRLDTNGDPIAEAKAMVIDQISAGGLAAPTSGDVNAYCSVSVNCQKAVLPTEIAVSLSINVLNPALADFSTMEVALYAYDRYSN